jgi:hypothetical protein
MKLSKIEREIVAAGWNVETKTFSDDRSVSVYFGGVWLCHDDSRTEAIDEASTILNAFANGAFWARSEFPALAGLV